MENTSSSLAKSSRFISRLGIITAVWAAFVALILSVQAIKYNGLFENIAEWQFANFEKLFPVSTILILSILFSLPLLVFLWLKTRRHRKHYGIPDLTTRIKREVFKNRMLLTSTSLLALITLVVFVLALRTGTAKSKTLQQLNFSSNTSEMEGPVQTQALIMYNRMAFYSQDTFFTDKDLLLAPVLNDESDKLLKYFIVLPSKTEGAPAERGLVEGYVQEDNLPGGLKKLFTNSGYSLDKTTYIIYPDARSALKPRYGTTESLLRLTLLFLLGTVIQWLYLRKLQNEFKESVNLKV